MKVPNHVAIILDGNGRWAKSQGKPRTYGHKVGAENVEKISRAAQAMGIKYLTLYAFSTENWKRPQDEVNTLMKLLSAYLRKCQKDSVENNMRVRIIGDREPLSDDLKKEIHDLEEISKNFDGFYLTIAVNYGGRDEIIRSARKAFDELLSEGKDSSSLTEELLGKHLDTYDLPDPDLMIRTSGEKRLSNYLLWQLAYAEFYFTSVPWPIFSNEDLKLAVEEYDRRNRRFGAV